MAVRFDELPLTAGLPVYLTGFTGRERETAELHKLLGRVDERLTTITGPGGVGKTRFAVHSIAVWQDAQMPAIIVFVDGAALVSGGALMPALAQSLGLEQLGDESSGGLISEFLADRPALIILDNLEHLLDATLDIAALLRACPGVRIVVTSRTPLRLSNERLFPLEPLPTGGTADGNWSAAADLFRDRARLIRGSNEWEPSSHATIEAICARLDGLPLAIELAAARLRVLSPEALLALLTRQLAVLADGPVDATSRHRTLVAAISWSYALLDEDEQRVFRLLGVFPESFSLEAVEAVCFATLPAGERTAKTLDRLTALFDQGLLQLAGPGDGDDSRYRMLVSIRDFAWDRLLESGQRDAAENELAHFVVRLAEARALELTGPRQGEAMTALAVEAANVRAVFDWAAAHADADVGLRLVAALWRFWANRGLLIDARDHIDRVMTGRPVETTTVFGAAARGAAVIAEMQTDWPAARDWNAVAIAIWEALGDTANLSLSWIDLGNIESSTGELDRARAAYEQAMGFARAAGDERIEMVARCSIGTIALRQGRQREAAEQFEQAIPYFRRRGDQWVLATALSNLGIALDILDRRDESILVLRESLVIRRALGDDFGITATLNNLAGAMGLEGSAPDYLEESLAIALRLDAPDLIGPVTQHLAVVAMRRGDPRAAGEYFTTSLRNFQLADSPIFAAETIELVAELIETADPEQAARLMGGTSAIRASRAVEWRGPFSDQARQLEARLKARLGSQRYTELHEQGSELDTHALGVEALMAVYRRTGESAPPQAPAAPASVLSVRELMVLRLLVDGKSDREIGAELFISPKTVNRHVTNILAKLDCRNRTAATAIALKMGLA